MLPAKSKAANKWVKFVRYRSLGRSARASLRAPYLSVITIIDVLVSRLFDGLGYRDIDGLEPASLPVTQLVKVDAQKAGSSSSKSSTGSGSGGSAE